MILPGKHPRPDGQYRTGRSIAIHVRADRSAEFLTHEFEYLPVAPLDPDDVGNIGRLQFD